MDAVKPSSLPKIVLLLAVLLVLSLPAFAITVPTLQVVSELNLTPCDTGGVALTVTSSGDPITFSVSSPSAFTISADWAGGIARQLTTPATMYVVPKTTSDVTNTLTLTPVSSGSAVQVSISYSSTASCSSGGSSSGGLVLNTSTLALTSAANAGTVSVSNTTTLPVTYSTASPDSWLTAAPASGSVAAGTSTTLTVTASTTGLSTGTHTGTVTITPTGGTALTVTVTFTVSSNTGTGTFTADGATAQSLTFTYQSGGTVPAAHVFALASSTDAILYNTSISLSNGAGWLVVNGSQLGQSGSPVSQGLSIAVAPTGMAAGTYRGNVTATAFDGGTVTVTVTLVVNSSEASGVTLSPTSYTFNGTTGSTSTLETVLNITLDSGVTLQSVTAVSSTYWLKIVDTTDVSGGARVMVGADLTALAAGTYDGTVTVLTMSSGGSATTSMPITLIVAAAATGSGDVKADLASVTLAYQTGGTIPYQNIVISNKGTSTTPIPFGVSSDQSWLIVDQTSANTSATLRVTIDPAKVSTGIYNGNITISPSGGTAFTIPVTLTVNASSAITATTATGSGTLAFTYRRGGAVPDAQLVTVASGSTTFTFTAAAAAADSGSWLAVTPLSGSSTTGSAAVSVAVAPSGLAAGTYTGTITVTGGGAATGSASVSVVLTVTAPLPTLTGVSNGASFSGAGIAPGEIISVFGSDLGPTTPVGSSLDSEGKLATTAGGVQVFVNGYPAPIVAASATQVNAIVPYEVANLTAVTGNVWVKYGGQTSTALPLAFAKSAPGIFTVNASGSGPAVVLNSDGTLNSSTNPAAAGSEVAIYGTGEGQTTPASVTGKLNVCSNPATCVADMPKPSQAVGVTVGGLPATVTYAGAAPSYVAGLLQVNFALASTTPSGAQSLVLSIGGNSSRNDVQIYVK
jgi:uncharacterized protein (TIGR03437 family)